MTLLTEFKDKTASLARLLTAAMTSMLLLSILAPSGSGGTNDGVLNFSNTPFTSRGSLPSLHSMLRARVQARARAQSRSPSTRQGRSRDATPTRAVRFTLFVRYPDGAIITFDAPGAGTGPRQGTRALQHQPGRHDRGLLQRRERCVSRFPAHSGRCDHYLQRPGCGHRSRRRYLRRQHQSGEGRSRDATLTRAM